MFEVAMCVILYECVHMRARVYVLYTYTYLGFYLFVYNYTGMCVYIYIYSTSELSDFSAERNKLHTCGFG